MSLDFKLSAMEINEILWRTNKTISTAESCTSGRIASYLTSVPGASSYFRGGLVAYSDDLKTSMLKVDANLIAEKTSVCEEVVRQMVIGANEMFGSDYSIAVSGFAGPGGPDPKTGIRVGTIWIAAGNAENLVTMQLTEDEGREHNIQKAVAAAMHMLVEIIKQDIPEEPAESEEATTESAE
ncbi:MAG: CinA family protein [Bacteroidales bacterium]|nr:CinA family protein [Bacteroidales bacterium]